MARMADIEERLTFTDPAGHAVSAILATPDAPHGRVVLLCHGFLSNKNSATNRTLTRLLLEQGLATFRFDFFGQGDSDGPFERILLTTALGQARAAVDLIRRRGYGTIGLIGSSFGGLVATLAASDLAKAGRPLAALGLKCPVADFPEELRLEFGDEGMARWRQTDEVPDVAGGAGSVRLRYALYEDCLRYDAYKAAEAIRSPTLIVQGDQDELVPLHQSRRLFEALGGVKRLDLLPGADHQFTKGEDFRTMTTRLAAWMIEHLPAESR